MIKFTAALLSLVAAIAAESAAGATTAAELRLACRALEERPQSPAGVRCRSYLSGFIEGAAAAGKLVLANFSVGQPDRGWEERAARTRLGARLRRETWLRNPEFCVPDPAPIDELARRIAREGVEPSVADELPAADLLHVVLKRHYRCARE